MKKLIVLLIMFTFPCYGAWDNDLPADSSVWNDAAGYIRDNNDALEAELGVDLNEAHPYFQAAAPTKKPDGSTALDVDDNGRLWVDSDDNTIYILTAFAGPTWTSTAAADAVTSSDPTFTLSNTDEEDSDGGRQSRFIGKGEQSGGESTTLGYTEFSHDGTSDDEKGKYRVVLNSGSESDSPSNVPIEYSADGKIIVSTSLSVLDEDDLSSDGEKVLATQQSIKAYADGVNSVFARLYVNASNQAVSSANATKVTFDGESFDSGTIAGSNKITPAVEGYYIVTAAAEYTTIASGNNFRLMIYKNGAEIARQDGNSDSTARTWSLSVSDVVYFDSNDYVEIYVQSADSSYSVSKNSHKTFLSVCKIAGI